MFSLGVLNNVQLLNWGTTVENFLKEKNIRKLLQITGVSRDSMQLLDCIKQQLLFHMYL